MVGDDTPLFFVEQPVLAFEAGHDALDGGREVLSAHLGRSPTRRGQCGFVDQVGEISASETWRERGDLLEAEVAPNLHLRRVHLEDFNPPSLVGPIDEHLPVESPCA